MSGRDFTALDRFWWSLSVETAEGKFLGGTMFMVLVFLILSFLFLGLRENFCISVSLVSPVQY